MSGEGCFAFRFRVPDSDVSAFWRVAAPGAIDNKPTILNFPPIMDWLARKLYPNARAYERRSRMQVIYLVAILILVAMAVVVGALVFLDKRPGR